jgi:hypothetical protein
MQSAFMPSAKATLSRHLLGIFLRFSAAFKSFQLCLRHLVIITGNFFRSFCLQVDVA